VGNLEKLKLFLICLIISFKYLEISFSSVIYLILGPAFSPHFKIKMGFKPKNTIQM